MSFLLDTSVAIPLRDNDTAVRARLEELDGEVLLSIITRVELEGGVYRDPSEAVIRRSRLGALLLSLPTIPFDDESADAYARIVAFAGYSRRKLIDRMIAAQALAHSATLITLNALDFRDIPELVVLDWK